MPPKRRMTVPQQDAPAGGLTLARKVSAANRWRAAYNPLRGLNLSRAVTLLEAYPRGEMADLQWTFSFIEGTDPDLLALIERRTSAVIEMDWDAKIIPETKVRAGRADKGSDFDQALADDQQAALNEAYNALENLYETVEHVSMAPFRGYAHAEKITTVGGDVKRFEIVDQWNVVRDGFNGPWKYNPEAQSVSFAYLPDAYELDPQQFLIREVRRYINRVALIKFIRNNLSEKDWDAFIEIYGIPGGVIIGPPNVPEGKEAEYEAAAREVAEGGSGYLPNQADYKPNDGPRGTNPFKERLDHLSEKLILAGTGGLLTMLTAPGSGTLAGSAHQETFQMIAKGDARKTSEVFQKQFDKPLLARLFPGKPVLAYFELALNEETETTQVVEDAQKLAQGGYDIDPAELSEKTGYTVTKREIAPNPNDPNQENGKAGIDDDVELENRLRTFDTAEEMQAFLGSGEGRALLNRVAIKKKEDALISAGARQFGEARLRDMKPVIDAIETVLGMSDANAVQGFRNLSEGLPQLLRIVNREPATAPVLANVIAPSLFNGFAEAADERRAAA